MSEREEELKLNLARRKNRNHEIYAFTGNEEHSGKEKIYKVVLELEEERAFKTIPRQSN